MRAIELLNILDVFPISTTESHAASGRSSRLARHKRQVADIRHFGQRRLIVLQ